MKIGPPTNERECSSSADCISEVPILCASQVVSPVETLPKDNVI